MKKYIQHILHESISVKEKAVVENSDRILEIVEALGKTITAGGKILLFGNGGSAADAQHIAAEFVNRFQMERPPLPAIALTTDTSTLTSIGNDYNFRDIFAKQVRAIGKKGDVAWGISTSGNSENVVRALTTAKEMGLRTIGMTGSGGAVADVSDLLLPVDSAVTARIQETHILYAHLICGLVDRTLFPEIDTDSA